MPQLIVNSLAGVEQSARLFHPRALAEVTRGDVRGPSAGSGGVIPIPSTF
jgi:hypothetical protein